MVSDSITILVFMPYSLSGVLTSFVNRLCTRYRNLSDL